MNILALLVFEHLFSIKNRCNCYEKDSYEYEKCIKHQKYLDDLLNQFFKDKDVLRQKYFKLLEDSKVQDFANLLMNIQFRLNEDMDKYINPTDQYALIEEFLEELKENEFDGFNH